MQLRVAKTSGMPLAPVMIYGDDVTHVLTEEGIAYLYRAESLEERRADGRRGGRDHRYRPWCGTPNASPRCVRAAKWSTRKISGFAAAMPPAPCWPPAASPTWWSGPTDCTTHRQNSGAGNEKSLPLHAESRVSWLARTASACLIDEARLSPETGSGG